MVILAMKWIPPTFTPTQNDWLWMESSLRSLELMSYLAVFLMGKAQKNLRFFYGGFCCSQRYWPAKLTVLLCLATLNLFGFAHKISLD